VGELATLIRLEDLGFTCSHDLLDVSGPVDDVDIRVVAGDACLALEAKCLLLQPNKRLFLINRIAHERSVARGADGYMPIFTTAGAGHAHAGACISSAEVEEWAVMPFQYGDPALGVALRDFCPGHLGMSEGQLKASFDQELAERISPAIMRHVEKAEEAFPRVREMVSRQATSSAQEMVSFYAALIE